MGSFLLNPRVKQAHTRQEEKPTTLEAKVGNIQRQKKKQQTTKVGQEMPKTYQIDITSKLQELQPFVSGVCIGISKI